MSGFPAAPQLSPVWKDGTTDGVNWYLLSPLQYMSADALPRPLLVVPAGFITDFASVPRALWNIYPPWGIYGPAAIVHDWLYWCQDEPRSTADKVLLEAMTSLGVDFVTRKAIYDAVAVAGQLAWDENTRRKAGGYTKMFQTPSETEAINILNP